MTTPNDMSETRQHEVEEMKPDIQECILYDFKSGQELFLGAWG